MANSTTLTFAGDADSLRRAAQQSTQALDEVSAAVTDSAAEMSSATSESADFTTKIGHLGSAVEGATTAIDSIGGSLTALSDIQNMTANRAAKLARLTADVEQAQIDQRQAAEDLQQANLDLTQSYLDGDQARVDAQQAAIDIKQATLDAKVATEEYSKAVKEHGKGSDEAAQAAIDLDQATADLSQAQLDQKQAQQDANQYLADGRQAMLDSTQAIRDGKDATLDLNDATREINPGTLQEWANNLEMVTPLITAVVGVLGLLTAAQWLWNASLWASPITWIVAAIAAIVVGVVLLATHTEELGVIWDAVWGGITKAASWAWKQITAAGEEWWGRVKALPDQLGSAFTKITGYITAPFRIAFNYVADAWNNTIGKLHWSVPGWVPGIGGNSISAPHLPKFHQGGTAGGADGDEFLAVLRAGETVSQPGGGGSGHAERVLLGSDGSRLGDLLIEVIAAAIERRGGDPATVLGVTRG